VKRREVAKRATGHFRPGSFRGNVKKRNNEVD
jgi:hypothetical protein